MKVAVTTATRAVYKGLPVSNEAAPWIQEYICRQRMAKIGYRDDFDTLDDVKCQVFMMISTEIDRLEQAEMKKKAARKR